MPDSYRGHSASDSFFSSAQSPSGDAITVGAPTEFVRAWNGKTDGTQLNAALAALGGPGSVIMPYGTAGIDVTVTPGNGQSLIGQGEGATILKLNAGVNADVIDNADMVNGNDHVSFKDFSVDGNKANQNGDNSKHGIRCNRVANGKIKDVEVHDVDGHGVRVDGQGVVTRVWNIKGLTVHDNSQLGYYGTFSMRNVIYDGITAYNNGSHGVEFDHSEAKATNIDAFSNTGRGIFIRNVFGSIYTNLHATLNGQDGIYVQGMVDSGGSLWYAADNSQSSSGTYNEVTFSGDTSLSYGITDHTVIDGIWAGHRSDFGTTMAGYGIFIGDATSGAWGNLKIFNAFVESGVTSNFRTPANLGNIAIWDWPSGALSLRQWQGDGIAAPNGGVRFGTANSQKIGFLGASPISQKTGGAKTASTTYGAAEATMLHMAYNLLGSYGLQT